MKKKTASEKVAMPRMVTCVPGLFPLLFAISAPLALSPLLYESGPFRLVYALCCSALLYTSHAVPVQTVALPSLALLPPLASPLLRAATDLNCTKRAAHDVVSSKVHGRKLCSRKLREPYSYIGDYICRRGTLSKRGLKREQAGSEASLEIFH
ncbi:hypothetical protein HPB51_023470 [Rhipicephalus microplus]|uniref:Uncharacterized protein n=1 Tax=Rhipicephalus microplus TaxID=6941 RepID=A0A9J6F8W7_RHIMP|nr:hypothetical protein HPB51_023470 [Rhipicephalus microplus]